MTRTHSTATWRWPPLSTRDYWEGLPRAGESERRERDSLRCTDSREGSSENSSLRPRGGRAARTPPTAVWRRRNDLPCRASGKTTDPKESLLLCLASALGRLRGRRCFMLLPCLATLNVTRCPTTYTRQLLDDAAFVKKCTNGNEEPAL